MKSLTSIKSGNLHKNQPNKVLNYPGIQSFSIIQSFSEQNILLFQIQHSRKVNSYTINLKNKIWKNWLQIYQWRSTTQLPIVKTYYINILRNLDDNYQLEIFNQYCSKRLTDFSDIPLSQILYLLKQSLIGFQRLYSKFGSFQVTGQMIGINQNKKCRVWFNQNFFLNSHQSTHLDQSDFIKRIIDVFSSFVLRTNLSKQFFDGFYQMKKFVKAFKYIDSFSAKNRMLVPFRLCLQPNHQKYPQKIFNGKTSLEHQIQSSDSNNSWNKSQNVNKPYQNWSSTSIKAETQVVGRMKYSNNTTKANSTRQAILSQLCHHQTPATQNQDQEIQIQIELEGPTTPMRKKNSKKDNLFRSQINDSQFLNSQNLGKKARKFSTSNKYEQKYHHCNSNNNINDLEQILEQRSKHQKIVDLMVGRDKQILSQDDESDLGTKSIDVFKKNGWQPKLIGLTGIENALEMKQSITIGKQISSPNKHIKLDKLGKLGRNIGQSMVQ